MMNRKSFSALTIISLLLTGFMLSTGCDDSSTDSGGSNPPPPDSVTITTALASPPDTVLGRPAILTVTTPANPQTPVYGPFFISISNQGAIDKVFKVTKNTPFIFSLLVSAGTPPSNPPKPNSLISILNGVSASADTLLEFSDWQIFTDGAGTLAPYTGP